MGLHGALLAVSGAFFMENTYWQSMSSHFRTNPESFARARRVAAFIRALPVDVLLIIGTSLLLAVAGGAWRFILLEKNSQLEDQVQLLERDWHLLSPDRDAAQALQTHIARFLEKTQGILDEKDTEKWTPALRCLAAGVGPDIQLQVIHLWKNPEDPSGRILRIEGTAFGATPRMAADHLSQELQKGLPQYFQIKEECRFERLADLPEAPSANPSLHAAAFVLVVPIGAPKAEKASVPQ